MKDGRHIIWSNDIDYDDWREDLEEQYGAAAHLLPRTYRCRGLPQKNQSAISTTKAVQRDLRRFFVGRNAKRVEKDALYKKFF